MAKNQCWSKGGGCQIELDEGDAAYFGTTLDSGEPAEWSEFTGVAEIDFAVGAAGTMTRCTGHFLTVTGQDDGGTQAVAVGDPLYYHDTTGVIDKAVNGGQFLGWAMDTATAQEEKDMCILLEQDPDYTRFMDEQLLEFGDGAAGKGGAGDVRIWFELDDQDFYVQNELEGSRTYIDSGVSTGRLDLQCHDYGETGGEQNAVRIAPRLTVDGATNAIVGLNVNPSIDDEVGAIYMIGMQADLYIRGGVENITNVMRAGQFQITDDGVAGRTITGPAILIRTWSQLHQTVTNGLYAIYSEEQGGTTAFTAWLYVDDDAEQADLASAVGAVQAVVSCEVGAGGVGYIAVYDGYTPT